jgi:hypothetical protein
MSNPTFPSQKLSPELRFAIRRFFYDNDLERVNRNLRRMLLTFLEIELRNGVPAYLEELVLQLNDIFELFDKAHEETRKWPGR